MRVAIHQPEHMPWPGFFSRMDLVDLFVVLDSVQFRKDYFQNRNRIVGDTGDPAWLTVPLRYRSFDETIEAKEIDTSSKLWPGRYLNLITSAYRAAPWFGTYAEEIFRIVNGGHARLVDLNLELIEFFRRVLNISTPLLRSSSLGVSGRGSTLNLAICKAVDATEYVSGPSGRDYLELGAFSDANVAVSFHEYSPPVYESPNYHPYLSTLDILFRQGPEAKSLLGVGELT